MQAATKDRLRIEALDHGQAFAMLLVGVGVALGLDVLFGHSRQLLPMAAVGVLGVGASMLAGAVLNLLLADLRARLYEAADAGPEPHAELTD